MSNEQRSGTGLVLLLALPAIIATIYLFFGIVRASSPPGSAAFALLALPIVVAVYFAADRLWTRGTITGTVMRSIVIAVICALGLAVDLPSMLTIDQRMRQKETMQRMRAIATALHTYAAMHHGYPAIDNVAKLGANLPSEDGWSHRFALRSQGDSYVLVSYGSHGEPDVASPEKYPAGPTTRFEDDIVMRNGEFIRYPEGLQ